jgi:hypothetical protein
VQIKEMGSGIFPNPTSHFSCTELPVFLNLMIILDYVNFHYFLRSNLFNVILRIMDDIAANLIVGGEVLQAHRQVGRIPQFFREQERLRNLGIGGDDHPPDFEITWDIARGVFDVNRPKITGIEAGNRNNQSIALREGRHCTRHSLAGPALKGDTQRLTDFRLGRFRHVVRLGNLPPPHVEFIGDRGSGIPL